MKNILRAFAFSLIVTGAVASVHSTSTATSASTTVSAHMPVPTCPPGDPEGCGIGQIGK